MVLANSGFPYSHLDGVLVCCGLDVASLGCHEHAPRSTTLLSLPHQDLGILHGIARESWQLLDSSPSKTEAALCLKQYCGRKYEQYFEQLLTEIGSRSYYKTTLDAELRFL